MPSNTTAYPAPHYEPLDSALKEIRVLEVAPTSGDGIVECRMKRISLLDDPVLIYETISYCWGPPRDPSAIMVNGHLAHVPASSEAAVRCMRLRDRPRILWIDAICIDQSSVPERSAQVAFMGTVYRLAKHNLIYLGEDDGIAERGVKAIQCVVDDMRAATANFTLLGKTIFDEVTVAFLSSAEDFNASVDYEALEALFNQHWFRRLWVLQEAVLAASSTCHWGTYKFDLLDTVRAALWLDFKARFIPGGLYNSFGWRCAVRIYSVLNPDNVFASHRKSLGNMFLRARGFERSEPRDSIFAILGLLEEDESLKCDQVTLLRVDYRKSLADVWRDATRYALCQDCHLDVLGSIDHDSDVLADTQTFPTWSFRAEAQLPAQSAALLPSFFRACKGLEAPSSLSDVSLGENVLLLEGIVVDEVLQTTITCFGRNWETEEGYHEWLSSVKDMTMHHCNNTMQEDLHLAIAFTLVAGKAWNGKQAQPKDLQVLLEYIESLITRKNGVTPDGTSIEPRVDVESIEGMTAASDLSCCLARRFFVIADGRIGLGPRCMRPEDIVVILKGGLRPFILRKKFDGYWLLGEAYVHGIMYGEAVQIAKEKGTLEQVFHVR